jgi:LuxR family transcriptional regulator, maltose regulon positive regulatory protein
LIKTQIEKTMPSLLQTKIQLPPLRSEHVVRERILEQMESDSLARLVLLSAPAGFGKSSALIQWAHNLRKGTTIVAWYALDERDNDPARFAAHLLETMRTHVSALSSLTDHEEPISLQGAVDQILNAVTTLGEPIVLILDDYHLISEPRIHNAIGRMCDYMPPNMRLAVGTRADPPLQLARLRVRGQITEIRMGDLRFNTQELQAWLGIALGWTPSRSSVNALELTTEGWAAAIALIVMRQNYGNETALQQQLARYSQSQRHIFEYFAQEILDHQPKNVRQFLLDTCVLDRLEPELCQAITDQTDAPLVLNQLANASLFVIPLSDHEPIYRYHHLFADFLRDFLHMQDQEQYRNQHIRAAEWYAIHGYIVDAVHHALAAEDFDSAARLIEDRAWEALTTRGEIMTIIRWLSRFPENNLSRHPRLCLYFSRALYLTGDVDRAQQYVQMAMAALNQREDRDVPYKTLWAIASGYQATLAAYRGDVDAGKKWIKEANALRDFTDGVDKVRIANTDAFLRYLTDTIPSARRAYEHALALAQAINHDFLALDAHFYLAQIDLLAGELQAVEDRCKSLLAQYTTRIAPLSAIMIPLGRIQYQRNQVVQAEVTLRNAIDLAQRANLPDILWFAFISLAEVLAVSETDEAATAIEKAKYVARGYDSPLMASIIDAAHAQLMLRAGQVAEAAHWAAVFQPQASGNSHQEFERTVLIQVLLAEGQVGRALVLAAELIADARQSGRMWYVIGGHMLQALAHKAAGDVDAALDALATTLTLANPHGFVRLFLDAGPPMQTLLRTAVNQHVVADYAAHLLDIAARADHAQHPADMLTEREIEVLEHIAAGASNQDIAEALVISLGTVKSHIHRLMNKLDAQNRTEAVNKARSLNILSD